MRGKNLRLPFPRLTIIKKNKNSRAGVSKSDVDKVCKYILNQPEHHRKMSFQEEYDEFIKFYQKTLQPFEKGRSK